MPSENPLADADAHYRAGRYVEAIRTYESIRHLRPDKAYQAFIDLNVAQSLRRQGHAAEAKLMAQRGLERLSGARLIPTTAELFVTLGNVEADLGRHTEALSALDKAYDAFQKLHNTYGIYQTLVAKARSLAELDQIDEAREVLGHILSSKEVPPIVRSQALGNLAVLESDDNVDRARELLEEDLELHGQLDDDYGRAGTLINMALIEIKQNDLDKAIVLLESARDAASTVNATDLLARALTMLQDIPRT